MPGRTINTCGWPNARRIWRPLPSFAGHDAAASRANQLLQAYRGYLEYPNRDNVLGPSRLFFSTYLESIWIGNYLAAAMLLREAGLLDDGQRRGRGDRSRTRPPI